MSDNIKGMLEALEYDRDFLELKQKYEAPNGFTIMGNKRREEWHSSFVCWLLDPKQNHRLGGFPLKKFLELVRTKTDIEIEEKDIANMSFDTEHQTTKRRRIDIWGISESLVLVIENKIKAKETEQNGKAQSDDYYEYCEENCKDKKRCYVLLKKSSNGSLANKNFVSITYQELYDEVIKPACVKSRELKLEDTEKVLEQYALDISNPYNDMLAVTQKEIASKIYQKHEEIIEIIRKTIESPALDQQSDIYKFFDKNVKYINNVILKSLGKRLIKGKIGELIKGRELIEVLLNYNYIIPEKTELVYKRKSATCIIMIDKNKKFYTGYYIGEYDGSQEVDLLQSGFEKLRDAELVVEKAIGSTSSNGGKSVYDLTLLNSGVEEAEGKTIRDILYML